MAVGAAWCGVGAASAAAGAAVARRATPLHYAAWNGNAAVTAALLVAGADASIKDWIGYAAPRRTADRRSRSRRVARRRTAERLAQDNGKSGAYAAAVVQARGRAARHRLPHAGMGLRSLRAPD